MSKRQIFSMIRQGGMGDGAARPDTTGIISLEQLTVEYEQASRQLERVEHENELDLYTVESLWDMHARAEQMIALAGQLTTESNPEVLRQVHSLTCESLELFGVQAPSMESLGLESDSDEVKKGIFRRMMDALIALWRRIIHRIKMIFSPKYRREQKLKEALEKTAAAMEEAFGKMAEEFKVDPMGAKYSFEIMDGSVRKIVGRGEMQNFAVPTFLFDTSMIEKISGLVREYTKVLHLPSEHLDGDSHDLTSLGLSQKIKEFANHTPRSPWRAGGAGEGWILYGRVDGKDVPVLSVNPKINSTKFERETDAIISASMGGDVRGLDHHFNTLEEFSRIPYNGFQPVTVTGMQIQQIANLGKDHVNQAERFYSRLEQIGVTRHLEECQKAIERHKETGHQFSNLALYLRGATSISSLLTRLISAHKSAIGTYTSVYHDFVRRVHPAGLRKAHELGTEG